MTCTPAAGIVVHACRAPSPAEASREAASRAGRAAGRRAFTLIELTVVLAVLVTLALILTPSIANSIGEARAARARNDCQIIANGIYQFFRDTGFFPAWRVAPDGGAGAPGNRLQVLVSQGNVPSEDVPSLWTTGVAGSLADQLATNAPGYVLRSPASPFGWNGPYFSSQMLSDPWGNRYAVNVALVDLSSGTAMPGGQARMAVWVLSAGPNGIIETPFAQSIHSAIRPGGDDIGTRVQ